MAASSESQPKEPKRYSNRDVAELLATVSDILQILEANRFRVIAFQNAAEAIRTLGRDINTLYEESELQTIPGVGKGIAESIGELLSTGRVAEFEELKAQVPSGVVDIIHVPDVGPKTARRLWQELGITDVAGLKQAAEAGEIRALKGFGAKSEQKILKGIELAAQRSTDRMPIGEARPIAQGMVDALLDVVPEGAIARIEIAGSLRRWRETIGDLDILVISEIPADVMAAYRSLPQVQTVVGSGETKTSVVLITGLQADLRIVEARHWGAALQYFTGSKEHNVAVRELAQRQGWSLNEYGLTATGSGAQPEGEQRFFYTEEDLYAFLGLAWVPPELRENRGEIQAARNHELPDLITNDHIRGELHGHTDWSDGSAPLEQMAAAAQRRGYQYWNVSDHSVGLGMVGGLDGERLARQADEIRKLNDRYRDEGVDFTLLRGIEVEILADGTLGLPDDVLEQLDVVVASIHSGLRQDKATITARCLAAIHNPHVDILGHATGRMVGTRAPADLDMEEVLKACAETGTVVEINAHPSRLDVNDAYARRAVEIGCRIAINSDAHQVRGMEILPYGIAVARRAWLRPADVVNTYSLQEMFAMLKDAQKR